MKIIICFIPILLFSCGVSAKKKVVEGNQSTPDQLEISKENLMGNWYLNEWTLCHTLYFEDTILTIDHQSDTIYAVAIDNHIDTLYFLTMDLFGDTLELRSSSSNEIFRNRIISITKEELILDGILDIKEKRTYFRTKQKYH